MKLQGKDGQGSPPAPEPPPCRGGVTRGQLQEGTMLRGSVANRVRVPQSGRGSWTPIASGFRD